MERMWQDIVVISFEGVTEFCGTFFSVLENCVTSSKAITTASFHILFNSLLCVPSYDTM